MLDPSSFAARRSAASNLPSFQLPPPPELPPVQKFASMTTVNFGQPLPFSAGNLLTPPSTVPGETIGTFSSAAAAASYPAITPYSPLGCLLPGAMGGSPYELGARQAPSSSMYGGPNQVFSTRPSFSPSLSSMLRQSPGGPMASGDGGSLPPPPPPPPAYDLNATAFPSSMPLSATSTSTVGSLPTPVVQHSYATNAMSNQPASSATVTGLLSPMHGQPPGFSSRPTPVSSYYHGAHPASAPAHQTSFPPSDMMAPSPPQPSPISAVSASRMSPISPTTNSLSLLHPASAPAPAPAPGSSHAHLARSLSFSLPAMPNPMIPNLHAHAGQMAFMGSPPGGLSHPYDNGVNMYRGYTGHPRLAQPARQNERPFRCNQCPHSFNRNHDLKRHKRIHLAVKPFPCSHCEKSFSRKDALKVRVAFQGLD